MRVTTKGRYALRAIINLAKSQNDKPKSIKSIAAEENISPEFLEQIFFKLKKSGIIDSVRGPGGGFILRREPETVSLKDLFEAVDEGMDLTPCSNCSETGDDGCVRMDSCIIHDVWREASEHLARYFGEISLAKILAGKPIASLDKLLSGADIQV